MSEGARDKAEQIVDDFANISMLLWDEDAALPEQIVKRDRLVAALAAAIKVDYESNLDGHVDCLCPKCELRYILSVLQVGKKA